MPALATPRPVPRFLTSSIAVEMGVLITLSVLFPFLIHIVPVPEEARLGVRLLPMFYAPLLAALTGRPLTAFAVALTAPWLNWLLTSHPSPKSAFVMTAQLLVFVVVVRAWLRTGRVAWCSAVPAYAASIGISIILGLIAPTLLGGRPVVGWAAQTIIMTLPGVALLLLINWLAVRTYPPGPSGPATA